jgi:hypothetical protein
MLPAAQIGVKDLARWSWRIPSFITTVHQWLALAQLREGSNYQFYLYVVSILHAALIVVFSYKKFVLFSILFVNCSIYGEVIFFI